MDINTVRTLITQRNQYNEGITKINIYLNQLYESALISGNMDQLNQLREILSGSKNTVQTPPVQTPAQKSIIPQTKSVTSKASPSSPNSNSSLSNLNSTNANKASSKLAKQQIAESSSESEKVDVNEQHLNTWRDRVSKMSLSDLKENKKEIENQIEGYNTQLEQSKTDEEKTKNLLSAEYYMKCLSIINDRLEVVNKNAMKNFESRASAALTRKDIMKNKQSISEAPSAEEISSRNKASASDDDSRKGKKSNSKQDASASESKKGKIKIQVDASKSDDGSESNIETPKPEAIASESSE